MTYSYKYSSCHDNAQQFGVYYEETVTASGTTATCTYPPAFEMRDEYVIIDPDNNTNHKGGIIGLWNTTDDPDTNLFSGISSVTKAGVITMGTDEGTDDILIKYYVAPQTYATPFPPVDTTSGNAVPISKEILQCLLNKCQFVSPLNLSRMGYRYAQVICRTTFSNDPSVSLPWASTSWLEVLNTDNNTYYDYLVPHDEYYPFVITELRVFSDSYEIEIRPSIIKTGYDNNVIGEGVTDHFNMSTSSTVYDPGDTQKYLLSIPLGPVACYELKVEGKGNGTYPTNTPAIGDAIVLEVSGYYMPLSGMEGL